MPEREVLVRRAGTMPNREFRISKGDHKLPLRVKSNGANLLYQWVVEGYDALVRLPNVKQAERSVAIAEENRMGVSPRMCV